MKQLIEKFLEFNGKTLVFISLNGVYWIALKPICEALNVNYDRQYRNITEHPILGAERAIQHVQVPGSQVRRTVCLPEYLIYGWIFSINSESRELLEYQRQCYKVLYDYFHGTITRRKKLFEEKARIQTERSHLEKDLRKQDEFVKLEDLRAREARIGKELKEMDSTELNDQLNLFKE